ncbi:MAG: MFS transporter [Oscillospiraceae bacterium]|nr:MFS transporter [Oscillospiraceae bacterium]
MAQLNVKNGKLDIGKTLLTGFGFMAANIAWTIYDPYITKILKKFLTASEWVSNASQKVGDTAFLSNFMATQGESTVIGGKFTLVPLFIGIIMTFDNIFGVIFQPQFGKLSDRCRSRLGKRRPFIVAGAPVSALLFAMIPFMPNLATVMACIIFFVFVMSLWRAPVVALMPDLTPPELRSDGNAIINLMGGVGGGVAMVIGSVFTAIYLAVTGVAKEALDEFKVFPMVFIFGSVMMIIAVFVLLFFVKEEDTSILSSDVLKSRALPSRAERKAEKRAEREAHKLTKDRKASLILMMACLFFLFCGSNAVQTFFALFAEEILHIETADATLRLLIFAVASMAAAIPAGKLGTRFGRKKTIIGGLALFGGAFIVFLGTLLIVLSGQNISIGEFINANINGAVNEEVLRILNIVVFPILVCAGAANMLITVNTLPLVLDIGGIDRVGTFTGYYYTATFSAQIASPIVYGLVRMFTGTYLSLFIYSPIAFLFALAFIAFVKHGEALPDEMVEAAENSEAYCASPAPLPAATDTAAEPHSPEPAADSAE